MTHSATQPAPKILFFVSDPKDTANDNQQLLPAAFRRAGWEATVAAHDSLSLGPKGLTCSAGHLGQYNKIWLLGFGPRASFFDRMQLLAQLSGNLFVNQPRAMLLLHGKLQGLAYSPDTYVSRDMTELLPHVKSGERWVVKPTARSHGEGVHLVQGQAQAQSALETLLSVGEYAILQRYVPAIEQGEVRLLFAAGQCLFAYKRLPNAQGITNMSTGATAQVYHPSPADLHLAQHLADELRDGGVDYCAIDLAGSFVIESNVANPGGLGTLQTLSASPQPAAADQVAVHLTQAWQLDPSLD